MIPPQNIDPLFLELQSKLLGRYSLERELGRGATGVVYLAREISLDRPVALKVLLPEQRVEARERFLHEARTAARLSHPHIVPILTVEECGTFVFFTMPYISGGTVGERVRSRGSFLPLDAVRLLRDVAWALAYSHGRDVIHRDIKPDNIHCGSSVSDGPTVTGSSAHFTCTASMARLTKRARRSGRPI